MPTELYWITAAPHGRLGITPRPRAGDWLADELASWKSEGVDVIVSLLTDEEITELDLHEERTLCEGLGMRFISHPIKDRNVPDSTDDFLVLTNDLHGNLLEGRGVVVHCRMGIGRSSLLAACLLVKLGLSTTDAFEAISSDRGIDVPDTRDQIEWVRSKSAEL